MNRCPLVSAVNYSTDSIWGTEMCDPVTIGVTTAAVSASVAAVGSIQQGQAANDVARFNARQQENEATRLRNVGVEQENDQRRATARLRSQQRAQLAAQGIDIESGSAGALLRDTDTLGEIDAMRIRRNTDEQATAVEQGSQLTLAAGQSAQQQGVLKAAGSLLGAAGDVSSKWFTPKSSASQGVAGGT